MAKTKKELLKEKIIRLQAQMEAYKTLYEEFDPKDEKKAEEAPEDKDAKKEDVTTNYDVRKTESDSDMKKEEEASEEKKESLSDSDKIVDILENIVYRVEKLEKSTRKEGIENNPKPNNGDSAMGTPHDVKPADSVIGDEEKHNADGEKDKIVKNEAAPEEKKDEKKEADEKKDDMKKESDSPADAPAEKKEASAEEPAATDVKKEAEDEKKDSEPVPPVMEKVLRLKPALKQEVSKKTKSLKELAQLLK